MYYFIFKKTVEGGEAIFKPLLFKSDPSKYIHCSFQHRAPDP